MTNERHEFKRKNIAGDEASGMEDQGQGLKEQAMKK
jgi:hypothetical protein